MFGEVIGTGGGFAVVVGSMLDNAGSDRLAFSRGDADIVGELKKSLSNAM